LETNKK